MLCYGRHNNLLLPYRILHPNPHMHEYITLHGKRQKEFADAIKTVDLEIVRKCCIILMGPTESNWVLKSWRGRQKGGSEKWALSRISLAVGSFKYGGRGQEMWAASRDCKLGLIWQPSRKWEPLGLEWQEVDFLLELPRRYTACKHLDFSLVRYVLDFWTPDLRK